MGIKIIRQQDGFTIIEISLFFAVAAMLLFTMMIGISLAVQRQRFSDSVHSTQSFLQQQYNQTQITINNRQIPNCTIGDVGNNRSTSGCLVLGKIVDLGLPAVGNNESQINSYNVITSKDVPEDISGMSDIDLLNQVEPIAVKESSNDKNYSVDWGAQLTRIKDSAGSLDSATAGADVRYILILRSPVNGLITTYISDDTSDMFGASSTTPLKNHIFALENSVKACINSADLIGAHAMLEIQPASSQDGVITEFDTNEADQWCN
ncbi:hypothetical protein A3F64_03385 [Candidatus Saccharibacteria bacterium RIFCSPHIGHO2_12_FULL_42_8]|nr:MAG: hypothetical protein A3F64_03385 [Candidatus Saccharibacteria bacterium RIFCSPHIGHO2_12_FULL_42_8]